MKVNPQLQLMEPSIQKRIFVLKACFYVIIKDYEENVKKRKKDNANVKSNP
jgi:hypothetical protein